MGKKGLAAIFSKPKLAATDGSPAPPWPWPSCANTPETPSFRRQQRHHNDDDSDRPCTTAGRSSVATTGRLLPRKATGEMYKTVNSVYFDPAAAADSASFFDDDEDDGEGVGDDEALDDCVSYSTTTASEEWSEAVIRSLGRTSTDRFFFDSGPPPASNSILAASRSPSPSPSPGRRTLPPPPEPKTPAPAAAAGTPDRPEDDSNSDADEEEHLPAASSPLVEESVAVALESEDPYGDFRASMAEMVSAHGLRDWASLQEMLLCYLRINAKHNHALIIGAFVDLLVGLAATSSSATTSTATTATMTTTTTTTVMTAASTRSSSSSSSSVAGDGAATCSTTAATTVYGEEQCGGGGETDASCSPVVSSDQEGEGEDEQVRESASDDELALRIRLS